MSIPLYPAKYPAKYPLCWPYINLIYSPNLNPMKSTCWILKSVQNCLKKWGFQSMKIPPSHPFFWWEFSMKQTIQLLGPRRNWVNPTSGSRWCVFITCREPETGERMVKTPWVLTCASDFELEKRWKTICFESENTEIHSIDLIFAMILTDLEWSISCFWTNYFGKWGGAVPKSGIVHPKRFLESHICQSCKLTLKLLLE